MKQPPDPVSLKAMAPEERYLHDPWFHNLVNAFTAGLQSEHEGVDLTLETLRQALELAHRKVRFE